VFERLSDSNASIIPIFCDKLSLAVRGDDTYSTRLFDLGDFRNEPEDKRDRERIERFERSSVRERSASNLAWDIRLMSKLCSVSSKGRAVVSPPERVVTELANRTRDAELEAEVG
jgi:hypothetical protein